ncbi:unnamed protein product [Candidula unifasciata]|uniref:Uncharacterized protein n=1 Tax=Candidula unifasciata TaxID=100452 RepID=A0A8S3YUQ3_9EUPU|nr:unnamed protein product [Candidula unifasciata]
MEQPEPFPILNTVLKRVQFLAENFPEKELFVFYEGDNRTSLTCSQVFHLAGKFAYRLRHLYGFRRSDVIVSTLPNSPERLIVDLGIMLAGCTCMNGQILLADGSDFFRSATNSQCSGIVLRPDTESPAWRLLHPFVTDKASTTCLTLSCDQSPELRTAIGVSRTSDGTSKPWLEDLRDSSDQVFIDSTVGPEDLLYVFTTSGSTGYSKLVPRTQAEIVSLGTAINFENIDFSVPTGTYSDRNLGWVGGYPFTSVCLGEKRVLQDLFSHHGKVSGESIWKAVCREKCFLASLRQLDVESVVAYIDRIGGIDHKIHSLFTGGQPVTQSQVAIALTIAEKVVLGYGSTECGLLAMAVVEDAKSEDFFCGKAVPDKTLTIVDENGDECKSRQTGTILATGGNIFKGYFNRLEDPDPNTVKCFTEDGWFNTEDLGFWDEDKNLYVLGRNKDTITYGNYVLYPGWLEAEILQHPDVADAFVLPVSDPVRYHEICACVTPVSGSNVTEDQLKSYCESIFIADLNSYQTPMPKYFMVLDSFPETPTGKPDKQRLRKLAEEKFGAGRSFTNVLQ